MDSNAHMGKDILKEDPNDPNVNGKLFCDFLEIKDVILCGLKYGLYNINAVPSIKRNNYNRPGQIQEMLFKHCCHLSIKRVYDPFSELTLRGLGFLKVRDWVSYHKLNMLSRASTF